MATQKLTLKRSFTTVFAGLLLTQHLVFAQSAPNHEDAFWYVQGQISTLSDHKDASFQAALGGPVRVDGSQALNNGRSGSLAVGRQMTYRDDNGDKIPLRLELESWSGRYARERVSLGVRTETVNDQVRFNVIFLNAAIRLAESEKKYAETLSPVGQFWLKAGVGLGTGKYPDTTYNFGCACMRAADSRAASYQLQLIYEVQSSKNVQIFGQLGRVWLPSVGTEIGLGGSQTRYQKLGTDTVSLGLRYAFH
jgi:hypothetical protein